MSVQKPKQKTVLLIDGSASMAGKYAKTAEDIKNRTGADKVFHTSGPAVTHNADYRMGAPTVATVHSLNLALKGKPSNIVFLTDERGDEEMFRKFYLRVTSLGHKVSFVSMRQEINSRDQVKPADQIISEITKKLGTKADLRPNAVIKAEKDLTDRLETLADNESTSLSDIATFQREIEDLNNKIKTRRAGLRSIRAEFESVSAAREGLQSAKPAIKKSAPKKAAAAAKK